VRVGLIARHRNLRRNADAADDDDGAAADGDDGGGDAAPDDAAGAGGGGLGDDDESAVSAGLFEKYTERPVALEAVTLYEFAVGWNVRRATPADNADVRLLGYTAQLHDRAVARRLSEACARVYPHMTAESHGAEHTYSMLLLHMPWRTEVADLPAPGDEAALTEMFLANRRAIEARVAIRNSESKHTLRGGSHPLARARGGRRGQVCFGAGRPV
jgi:hypothetical protein